MTDKTPLPSFVKNMSEPVFIGDVKTAQRHPVIKKGVIFPPWETG
jgi:hypothetical protein